jgi:hypothetical protein
MPGVEHGERGEQPALAHGSADKLTSDTGKAAERAMG